MAQQERDTTMNMPAGPGWYQTLNGPRFWDGHLWAESPVQVVSGTTILPGWHQTDNGVMWWNGQHWENEAPLPPPPPSPTSPPPMPSPTSPSPPLPTSPSPFPTSPSPPSMWVAAPHGQEPWTAPPPRRFLEAFRVAIIENYANPRGRASRSEFWWAALWLLLLSQIPMFTLGFIEGFYGFELADNVAYAITDIVVVVALFLPTVSVTFRRMHDQDLNGIVGLIPLVGLIFALLPGTNGPNRYDHNPQRIF